MTATWRIARKRRQRQLLWMLGFGLILPLAFVSFETWLTWVIYGVFLAIPVLALGTVLVDTIYNLRGGYDRRAQDARSFRMRSARNRRRHTGGCCCRCSSEEEA